LVKLQTGVYFFDERLVGYKIHNMNVFHFKILMQLNWKGAKDFCVENGMNLAVIESAEEAKQVADAAPLKNSEFFFPKISQIDFYGVPSK